MEELKADMSANGYEIDGTPILDGKLHRFDFDGSKDAGWYIGWINQYKNEKGTYQLVVYGDWKTDTRIVYKPGNLSNEDRKYSEERVKKAQALHKIDKQEKQEETSKRAVLYLESAKTVGVTPYMKRKLIASLGRCYIEDENLLVPMVDVDGKLWGIQKIMPDGKKIFMPGQKTDGCFHVIGSPYPLADSIICEGYATGVSLHEATNRSVIVTFSASNLVKVAKALAQKFQPGSFTIAADDDQFTAVGNAGRKAGEEASLILQTSVVFPKFKDHSAKPTDFNDLHLREGIEKVSKQLKSLIPPKFGFRPVGVDDNFIYVYQIETASIVKLPINFSKNHLFRIAPLDYWLKRYRNEDDGKMNWLIVQDQLVSMCSKIGGFNGSKIRGVGVWRDGEDIVLNEGDRLTVNGAIIAYENYASDKFYVHGHPVMRMQTRLTLAECAPLANVVQMLNWSDPHSGFLLCGWIVASMIAPLLPIRPHIGLTGPSGSGKSTVLLDIVRKCLGPSAVFADGGTTEAGLRQRVRGSSVPVVLDEFEGDTDASISRIEGLTELLRVAHSSGGGRTYKGSTGGQSDSFDVAFCALVSAINFRFSNAADISRFTILEMKKRGNSPEQFAPIRHLLSMIDEDFGEKLRGRIIYMNSKILESCGMLTIAFQKYSNDMRSGQQLAILFGCSWAVLSDEVISPDQADALAKEFFESKEKIEEVTDQEQCLNHLVTSSVIIDGVRKTIGDVILNGHTDEIRQLKVFGIAVSREKNGFSIPNSHSYLSKDVYKGTRWNRWNSSLGRLDGAIKHFVFKLDAPNRGVFLPMSVLDHVRMDEEDGKIKSF